MEVSIRRFEAPDEARVFDRGRFEVIHIGGLTVGRARYDPGWKWSTDVGRGAGETCRTQHVGLVLSGRAAVRMDDGTQQEIAAGDLFEIAPGHDSWVVGEEPYVSLHLSGAERYATDPVDGASGELPMSRRLQVRINDHDLEGFVACFDDRYESEQPAHPGRAFTGSGTVRHHWSGLFTSIPDLRAAILGGVAVGDTEWAEWRWHGTTVDDRPFEARGVIVLVHHGGRIVRARLFMEPVETETRAHSV
jgi:ketosteroid isomerase-like protein